MKHSTNRCFLKKIKFNCNKRTLPLNFKLRFNYSKRNHKQELYSILTNLIRKKKNCENEIDSISQKLNFQRKSLDILIIQEKIISDILENNILPVDDFDKVFGNWVEIIKRKQTIVDEIKNGPDVRLSAFSEKKEKLYLLKSQIEKDIYQIWKNIQNIQKT